MVTQSSSVKLARVFAPALAFMLAVAALPATAADSTANITDNPDSTIVIHKRFDPSGQVVAATSHEQPAEGATALNGVPFTVEKVAGINLTTNEGWTKLKQLKEAKEVAGSTKSYATVVREQGMTLDKVGGKHITSNDGTVTIDLDGIGAYVVTEGADEGNNGITHVAEPFLVTVPFASDGAASGWNYNVHVYPKSSISLVEKTYDSTSGTEVGKDLRWYVSFTIPAAGDISSFEFQDLIDEDTKFKSLGMRVVPADTSKAQFRNAYFNSKKVVAFESFNEGFSSEGKPAVPGVKGKVVAKVTNVSQTAILKANRNQKLLVEVTVAIMDKVTKGGLVNAGNAADAPNEPWAKGIFRSPEQENLNPGDSGGPVALVPTGSGAPSVAPWTTADILTWARGANSAEVPVKGVVFKVFKNKADADACSANSQATECANALVIGGDNRTEITAADDGTGTLTIPNGANYLAQIGTVPGYKKLAPIKFAATAPGKITPYSAEDAPLAPVLVPDNKWKIQLVKQDAAGALPDLPMTGAAGQLLLALGGGAVLLTAMGTFLVGMRQKKRG